ncbi:MAG: hypothetical protein GW839_07600 [Flavobacteriales bacterium]|nr:hypothetical protein [Flavobacteriales bacterium]
MKTKILLLSIVLAFSLDLIGQEVCGTPHFSSENQNTQLENKNNTYNESICLNIYFHIVRDNNGSGGINPNQLDAVIDNLSQFYNPFDIYFVKLGFDYIDNSNLQQIGDPAEAGNLAQINNQPNAINYYIVESLWNTGAGYVTGTAISIPSNRLVIRIDRVLSSTSSHEVGHCLNLLHTFESSYCTESIDGSNCASCGDKVCDTPADANTGSTGGYSPDLTNLMFYYSNRTHFTNGQADRIRQAFASSSLLQQIISNSCSIPAITGNSTICGSAIKTYTLENGDSNATTDWQISSNLKRIGANNTSIGVQPLSNYNSESGWVSAYQSGKKVATKSIWLNTPLTGILSYCEDVVQTTCYLSGATSQVQIGSTTTFSLIADGNVSEANYTDWEWQKSSGNFTFVSGGGGQPN